MKHNKGITCKTNSYHVTAVAVKDKTPVSITFDANERNSREAKRFAANELGVKASQVLVSFELEKRAFTIACTYDELMNALGAADIPVTVADDSEPSE